MNLYLDGYAVRNNLVLEDYSLGMGEALSATAEESWLAGGVSSISRIFELNQANPKRYEPGMVGDYAPEKAFTTWQSKEKAENQIKKQGVPLDIPDQGISQEKLDVLIARKREELKRQTILSMAPQHVGADAAKFGTALLVSIADPINLASAFVPVVSQARMAQLSMRLGRTGGRVATGVIEGAVGAALVEPLTYAAKIQEQAEYDMYDVYLNLTVGAVLGGGLHAGLGYIGDVIGRNTVQTRQDLLRTAMGQALDNRPVDVTQVADASGISRQITSGEARRLEMQAIREELAPIAEGVMPRGEVKTLRGEIKNLEFDRTRLEEQLNTVRETGSQALKKQGLQKTKETKRIEAEIEAVNAELSQRQQRLADNQVKANARSDISRLDADIVPKQFRERVRAIEDANARSLSEGPVATHSPEADPKVAQEAQQRLDSKPETTPEAVDKETTEIVQALNESGFDTAELTAEIAADNVQTMREANGMKMAVMCMLGVA